MSPQPFTRDRFTLLAYAMAAYFSYLQAAIGPLMPFLRTELQLDYTAAGAHFSAFALGMVGAGLVSGRSRCGRPVAFWGGAIGMATGAIGLALSRQVSASIASVLLMGFFGSVLSIATQASLSDRHGKQRAIALTESNVATSISAALVPLLSSGFELSQFGWRGALYLSAIALLLLIGLGRKIALPAAHFSGQPSERNRSLVFWVYWLALFFCVAIEYCIFFWGADFLQTLGFIKRQAVSTMSLFILAGFVGRISGSYLSRSMRTETLLHIAIMLVFTGFPIFWLANFAPLNILGLFIAGLGVANFYPLTLSIALSHTKLRSDQATAQLSIATGTAIFTAPFLLGWLADRLSLETAYGLVLVLLAIVSAIVLLSRRLAR